MLEALNQFRIYCSSCRIERFNSEFVNDIYHVINSNGRKENYLLQRINHRIFNDASTLMKNISAVLNYLYLNEGLAGFKAINFAETKEGGYYYKDADGYYWRLFQIPGRYEMQKITRDTAHAYAWAVAFGKFLSCVDEFPVRSPDEIVFSQRRIANKLKSFQRAIGPFYSGSRYVPQDEIDYVFEWMKRVAVLDHLLADEYPVSTLRDIRVVGIS